MSLAFPSPGHHPIKPGGTARQSAANAREGQPRPVERRTANSPRRQVRHVRKLMTLQFVRSIQGCPKPLCTRHFLASQPPAGMAESAGYKGYYVLKNPLTG